MATIRTLAQLLALYPDNNVQAITAGDGRDEIASCFGFFSSLRDPGPNDDQVGTGGSGGFFAAGSRWLNLVTHQAFVCYDGAVGAAVWKGQAFDGEAAGGRLAGQWPVPVLALTGVAAGAWGDASHYPTFSVAADGTLYAAGQLPLPSVVVTAPLTLQPPTDPQQGLILKQHSPTQTGNLLEFRTAAGSTAVAARITGSGSFSNPNPISGSGPNNERFGDLALAHATSAYNTVAIGSHAAEYVLTSHSNTFVGLSAGRFSDPGNYNTVVGNRAGEAHSGSQNVFIGSFAAGPAGTGNANVIIGQDACCRATGSRNVQVGQYAGYSASGNDNVLVGQGSGYHVTSGLRLTLVGGTTSALAATDTDEIAIGFGVTGHGTHTITIGSTADDAYLGSAVLPASNAINKVLASPGTGGPGPLTPRALVAADIPGLPASIITSGTFSTARIPSLDSIAGASGPLSSANLTGTIPAVQLVGLDAIAAVFGPLSWANLTGIPPALATSPVWIKVPLTYLDFNFALNNVTLTLANVAAGSVLHAIKVNCSIAFAGAGGGTQYSLGYANAAGGASAVGYYLPFDSLTVTSNDTPRTGFSNMPSCWHQSAFWSVTITVSDFLNLSNLTAGAVTIWLLVSDPG